MAAKPPEAGDATEWRRCLAQVQDMMARAETRLNPAGYKPFIVGGGFDKRKTLEILSKMPDNELLARLVATFKTIEREAEANPSFDGINDTLSRSSLVGMDFIRREIEQRAGKGKFLSYGLLGSLADTSRHNDATLDPRIEEFIKGHPSWKRVEKHGSHPNGRKDSGPISGRKLIDAALQRHNIDR
ncbi:MAG: hypothetical protein AB7G80_08210 [Dongiaceae bacterium]